MSARTWSVTASVRFTDEVSVTEARERIARALKQEFSSNEEFSTVKFVSPVEGAELVFLSMAASEI